MKFLLLLLILAVSGLLIFGEDDVKHTPPPDVHHYEFKKDPT